MAVPSRLLNAYSQILADLDAVERYVAQTLRPWCDDRGYPFKGRKKTIESLSEKLESGRYNAWSDIDDLYACTVVVPTSTHEDAVLEFLSSVFTEVETRKRNSTNKQADIFRFDSTRFIGRMTWNPGLDLPEGVEAIQFEVQIPTAFEYAWAVVTHDLVYKADDFDWRKARLAALLKASVEQSELLIAGFEANVETIPKSPHPESDAKREVVHIFKMLINDGLISRELAPASWGRFADNFYALTKSFAGQYAAPTKARELAKAIQARIGEQNPNWYSDLVSGSLFQLVLGMVGAGIIDKANLSKFVVVDSVELRDIHKLEKIPKAFDFNDK